MKQFVNKTWTIKNSLIVFFVLIISSNFVFANSGGKHTYKDIYACLNNGGLENLKANLESENDGVRMQSVDQVGEFKIIQLEDAIIKLFDEEELIVNKRNVAVTLYQLGTYKTLIKLEEAAYNNSNVSQFCSWLINEYNRQNNNRVSSIIKIEEMWAVDTADSMRFREEK